jgi:hypothetical protein
MSQATPSRQEGSSWMFWLQLLAGPILWSIHFIVSYLLVEAFCRMGWNFNLLGFPGLSVIVVVFTVLALLGVAMFGMRSYRSWRNLNRDLSMRDQIRETSQWSEGPVEFVYLSGLLLSVLFGVTILVVGIPALFLRPC